MTRRTLRVVAAALAMPMTGLIAGPRAVADAVPANTARIGMYAVFYHPTADDISGPFVPPGLNLQVKDVQTIYLAYVRRLTSHFDFELTLGVPPLTKTEGKGPATVGSVPYNGVVISTARWLAPSALLEYELFDESHALRPYLGVGVNYTTFYDRVSTAAGNAVSGGPTRVSLTSSVGPAGTIGLKYQPRSRWSVIASYSISHVATNLRADTAGAIRTTHVSFGPQALVVAAGYSF